MSHLHAAPPSYIITRSDLQADLAPWKEDLGSSRTNKHPQIPTGKVYNSADLTCMETLFPLLLSRKECFTAHGCRTPDAGSFPLLQSRFRVCSTTRGGPWSVRSTHRILLASIPGSCAAHALLGSIASHSSKSTTWKRKSKGDWVISTQGSVHTCIGIGLFLSSLAI